MAPVPAITAAPPTPPGRRRGSIYVFVLGLTAMTVVIGAGAIAVARLGTRSAADSRDWSEASVLAASAIDAAIARINSDPAWRSKVVSGATTNPVPVGRGRMSYRIVDESDDDLALGLLGPVRVYGIGAVGRARRCLSTVIAPVGETGPAVEALRMAAYSASTINLSGTTTFSGAPAGSGIAAVVALFAKVNGRVESLLVTPLGVISGGFTLLDLPKQMPSSSTYDFYAASAVPISFGATGGDIKRVLLSPAQNPLGPTDPDGIYFISVPNNGRLRIRECRIVGTLVVNLGFGAELEIGNSVNWAPASPRAPMLVVRAAGATAVRFRNGAAALNESTIGENLNPPHTPYNGLADNDYNTSYPAELRGVIHITGGATTTVEDSTKIYGALVSEGVINASDNATIIYDPTLLTNAPEGYTASADRMGPVHGTWRWEPALP